MPSRRRKLTVNDVLSPKPGAALELVERAADGTPLPQQPGQRLANLLGHVDGLGWTRGGQLRWSRRWKRPTLVAEILELLRRVTGGRCTLGVQASLCSTSSSAKVRMPLLKIMLE